MAITTTPKLGPLMGETVPYHTAWGYTWRAALCLLAMSGAVLWGSWLMDPSISPAFSFEKLLSPLDEGGRLLLGDGLPLIGRMLDRMIAAPAASLHLALPVAASLATFAAFIWLSGRRLQDLGWPTWSPWLLLAVAGPVGALIVTAVAPSRWIERARGSSR
jgi:uncharacterized membrane protein YhaH (DUF805 family)